MSTHNEVTIKHKALVEEICKPGTEILSTMDSHKAELMHCAFGIGGEAGELMDAVKKSIAYNKPLDLENVKEELGDIEFYMERLRSVLGLSRTEVLIYNYEKLRRRYPEGYSDKHAQERLDKQ